MKFFILIILFLNVSFAQTDNFESDAKALVRDLKMSLIKNLSEKIAKDGPVEAIPYCHANVRPIAKSAAKDRVDKYEFGRTSHKIRNPGNAPQAWAENYLKEFEGKKMGETSKKFIIHQLENSKRVYLEPLYVEAKCLLCHGETISENISQKIKEIYPNDKAVGFKLGEFRGFIWVKEK